ncbi:radical SAM/SPASM domain-containing protein [Actinoplanes regularis]|uniref:radical SAM/SPASM domain-containing protein n=1 Tax=Actinoplanes regularis TaxID=52697 RepID=UPI0024A27837|nr:radical SAM protein [Actinoplanes regularis]GLW35271.1 radical SAM/SPASM domain-containing protein [Actinoplanes regularis]
MGAGLATSRYTFRIPLPTGYALFNTSTGSALRIDGADADELSVLLSGPPTVVSEDAFGAELAGTLRRGGFLLDPAFDELAEIRDRYRAARGGAPVALTVTTTMDCNLGCYYCYESRSPDALAVADADRLVAIARDRLRRQHKRSLHVDWYRGEPLMNLPFLEQASAALQQFCRAEGVTYHASVVSNGTHWPDDVGAFVTRHRIRQVQISFDGLADNHNRRRRYRAGHQPADETSSFDKAVALVDRLLRHSRVDLRFNADHGNAGDLPGFIDFAKRRGWFDAPFRCVFMVAKLAAYSDRAAFLRPHELTAERFEELQALADAELPDRCRDRQDIVEGFPFPRTSVCGALADDSTVVGADGLEYRCGLQVGEAHRAVGEFGGGRRLLPLAPREFPDRTWWDEFDPTTLPTCARCSFLPVCWGGCPKRHLDGTQAERDAEARRWRLNLPRMIAAGMREPAPDGFVFSHHDQFRDEPAPPESRSNSGRGLSSDP